MATIDQVGNIHDHQGRFDGHIRSDAESTLADEPSAAMNEPTVYRIPTSRLAALQAKLDKLNRRLAKAGIEERFAYDARPRIVHDERTGASHETNDVTINTPRISLGDWQFDSMHEKAANGRVISHFAGDADPHIADETMRCDYCGHNRARTKVYMVTSPSTGETKQVGSNCLELFLGVKPAGLWALDEDFDASEFDVDDDDLGAPFGQDTRITLGDNVMLLTMWQIEQDGGVFLSRSRATIYDTPTADKVLDSIELGAGSGHLEASAAEADELRRLFAWVDGLAGESEYERNLQAALAPTEEVGGERWVATKHVPLVASAVSSFRHHEQRERERAAREELKAREAAMKKQEFLAPVGRKLKGMDVTATILSARLGQDYGYGAPLHVKMIDDDGHVLYWRSSSGIGDWIQTGEDVSEGVHWSPDAGSRVVIASGTVKENRVSDHDGDWETVLTRAKLQPTSEAREELAREAHAVGQLTKRSRPELNGGSLRPERARAAVSSGRTRTR